MFRVITFNANGIRAATRKGFFRWMQSQRPDIVCMQETKAQEHQIPPEAIDLPDYHVAFVDAQKKGYSGVAIYSRRKPHSIERGLAMPDIDAEGRFISMTFDDLTIASLYVPSGTNGPARQAVKYSFLDRFLARLASIKGSGKPTIICGDYNIAHRDIDVFDPVSCARTTGFLPDERRWFDDVIDDMGWIDAFRTVNHEPKQFSWWSNWPNAFERNLGWRIDYQLITPGLAPHVRAASIYRDERFSDHAPVTIDYDL
jgi:exodeoxyribonuclease-3